MARIEVGGKRFEARPVGSQCMRFLEMEPRDLDFLAQGDCPSTTSRDWSLDGVPQAKGLDLHVLPERDIRRLAALDFPTMDWNDMVFKDAVFYAYALDRSFGTDVVDFDFLGNGRKLAAILKACVDMRLCYIHPRAVPENGMMLKHASYFALDAFALRNRSMELTREQWGIVSKIHARKMPHAYVHELLGIINGL